MRSPQAFAVCDNCGFWYNHVDLKPEVQWQGNSVKPTGFLVCACCWDVPQPQLSSPVLPNDPRPILDPRPELNNSDASFELTSSADVVSSAVPAGEYADTVIAASLATAGPVNILPYVQSLASAFPPTTGTVYLNGGSLAITTGPVTNPQDIFASYFAGRPNSFPSTPGTVWINGDFVSITSGAPFNAADTLAVYFAGLPTTIPSTPGQMWLNGDVVSVS